MNEAESRAESRAELGEWPVASGLPQYFTLFGCGVSRAAPDVNQENVS